MSNFLVYSNKLRQWVPTLSPEQAEDFVNDAWRDIREANDQWSFLLDTEYWLSPASITLIGLGVTQFSTTVVLSHANLLQVANLNNPPITQRQLRFGLSGGPIYEIEGVDVVQVAGGAITATTDDLVVATGPFDITHVGLKIVVEGAGLGGSNLETTILAFVDPTQVQLAANAITTVVNADVTFGSSITLERQYLEDTNATQTALLYRLYYSPLSTDFQRLDHLTDNITGYEFGWEILPIDDLDRRDPQRSSVSEPYRLFFKQFDLETGLPVYELWPAPTVQRGFSATIWRLGQSFVNDTDHLPPQITEELLLLRARLLAYEWAAANEVDGRKAQRYQGLIQYSRSRYSTEGQYGRPLGLLDQTMRRDEEVALKQMRMAPRRPGPGWPVDSNFAQSHAIPPWWGG